MRRIIARNVLLSTLFFLGPFLLMGQEISISYGPTEIGINQYFRIIITVKNDRIRSYDKFPEIPGLYKYGTSSSTSSNIINGQISSTFSITQNYLTQEEGTYVLKPFTMFVNGKKIQSKGTTIKIGPAVQQRRQFYDPFEEFFGRKDAGPIEYINKKDEAFLAVVTDKSEVYIGEGFLVTLAFYVAETNEAELGWMPNIGNQIQSVTKNLQPGNCWEETFDIENLNGRTVQINGKQYKQFKLYQAMLYPFNLDTIHIPSIDFKMIKYKEAKRYTFFGRNKKKSYKNYKSKSINVVVKDLPDHPLKDQVTVGSYRLNEKINSTTQETGISFDYRFTIYGVGNISSINEPAIVQNEVFDIYPPNLRVDIQRSDGMVKGSKSFDYFAIANEPGTYDLGDYFQWIYFDPVKGIYDTLRSTTSIDVFGESKKNNSILSNDLGSFYNKIDREANTLESRMTFRWLQTAINTFGIVILVLALIFIVKR